MATFGELSRRLKKYTDPKNITDEVLGYLNDNKYIVLDIQREQLFEQNVDREGNIFGRYNNTKGGSRRRSQLNTTLWSPKTRKTKLSGQPFNLLDTGDFSNKLTMWIRAGSIVVTSRSPHLRAMLKNPHFQSTKFFGFTPENEAKLSRIVARHAAKWITKGIGNTPSD